MKIFHYSSLDYWSEIALSGLSPRHRLGRDYAPAFDLGAVFGLLEARPKQWIQNNHFPESWGSLHRSTGRLLLEIEIDLNEAYVIERGHMEAFLYGDLIDPPKNFRHDTLCESEKAYFHSIVPLSHYFAHPNKYDYSLPEVLLFNRVPVERIRISDTQEKLEDSIKMYVPGSIFRKSIIRQMGEIPCLNHFYDKYKNELRIGLKDEMRDGEEYLGEALK